MENKKKASDPDPELINTNKPDEIRAWAEKLA